MSCAHSAAQPGRDEVEEASQLQRWRVALLMQEVHGKGLGLVTFQHDDEQAGVDGVLHLVGQHARDADPRESRIAGCFRGVDPQARWRRDADRATLAVALERPERARPLDIERDAGQGGEISRRTWRAMPREEGRTAADY